jgi:hypothetical protein
MGQGQSLSVRLATMFKELVSQRLAALFVCGWLVLNFPLLGLWDVDATWWGVPVFPAALFALWALLIAAVAWLMERGGVVPEDA